MKQIALLLRTGQPYDEIYKHAKDRPWLKNIKQNPVSPEYSIYKYIQWKYPDVTIHRYTANTIHKLDPSKYDYVFLLFMDLVLEFLRVVRKEKNQEKYDAYVKKLKSIPNLVPSFKFIQFITNKCKYYQWLDKNKFPTLKTRCLNLKTKSKNTYVGSRLRSIRKNYNQNLFVKPMPSAETKNTKQVFGNTPKYELNDYVKYTRDIQYNKLIVQPFAKNFASPKNRELRTFWINNKYQYTIETEAAGWPQYIRTKPLPVSVKRFSLLLLNKLSKQFNEPMIMTRIDWGKTNGKYFINEIEYAPGTFAELFKPKDWDMDKKIGDFIVNY